MAELVSLSRSSIWKRQKAYYQKVGISAWEDKIPYFASSNAFLADAYAKIINAIDAEKVRIIELGAGCGQFSYYLLRRLKGNFHYLMTDVVEENLAFWRQQPMFQPFLSSGQLSFQYWDALESDPKEILSSEVTVIIANYVLDTLPCDCFKLENGRLLPVFAEEILRSAQDDSSIAQDDSSIAQDDSEVIQVDSRGSQGGKNPSVILRPKAEEFQDIAAEDGKNPSVILRPKAEESPEACYSNKKYNEILKTYQNKLTDSHILFPNKALDALTAMITQTDSPLYLLATDKAYLGEAELDFLAEPELTWHEGCFSMMVNYDAIAKFSQEAVLPPAMAGTKTALFALNSPMPESLKATSQAIFTHFNPADYLHLHRSLLSNLEHFSLEALVSHLSLAHWDPFVFQKIYRRIYELLDGADMLTVNYLEQHLKTIADQFYPLPHTPDLYFDLAVFYHSLKQHREALHYYLLSEQHFEPTFGLYFNQGICYYHLDQLTESKTAFLKAKAMDPDSDQLSAWLGRLA